MDFVTGCLVFASAVAILCGYFWRRIPFIDSLDGKHVFITGASTGIGFSIAKSALSQGAYVTITGRTPGTLKKAFDSLSEDIDACEHRLRTKAVDAGDYKGMSLVIHEAFRWKPVDVLICNAGLTRSGYLEQLDVEDLDLTVRTNLLGALYPVHAILPLMKERSPTHPMSIVFIGSLASLFLMYGNSVYTGTKHALKGIAESLRLELLPYSIRVTMICPGFVQTAFLDEAEKPDELQMLMKDINMYDRKQAQSPDLVAAKTLEAVKYGSAIATTSPVLGSALLMLTRGFIPDDSLVKTAQEILAFPLLRVFTLLAKVDMHRKIMLYHRRHSCPQQLKQAT